MYLVIKSGLRLVRKHPSVFLLFYIAKSALAAIVSIPLFLAVSGTLERSHFANQLLSGWSLDVLFELSAQMPNIMPFLIGLIMITGMIGFLLRQFLNGGLFRCYSSISGQNMGRFFSDSAELFTENLKISLVMALFYLLLFSFGLTAGLIIPESMFQKFGRSALYPLFIRFAFLYLFIIFGSIFSDLMRYRLAAYPQERIGQRLKCSWDIFRRQFVKLTGVTYAFFIPFVIIWILIEWLALSITTSLGSSFGVLLEFVLFQLCAVLRVGQSLAGTAAIGRIVASTEGAQTSGPAE